MRNTGSVGRRALVVLVVLSIVWLAQRERTLSYKRYAGAEVKQDRAAQDRAGQDRAGHVGVKQLQRAAANPFTTTITTTTTSGCRRISPADGSAGRSVVFAGLCRNAVKHDNGERLPHLLKQLAKLSCNTFFEQVCLCVCVLARVCACVCVCMLACVCVLTVWARVRSLLHLVSMKRAAPASALYGTVRG